MNQAMRARLATHTPAAHKAVGKRISAEPDLIGRRGLIGQAKVDKALELLRPVIEGSAEMDEDSAALAKIVLQDAYQKMKRGADGLGGSEPVGKA